MLGDPFTEAISFAPSHATLFALAAVLPMLFTLYVRCSLQVNRLRPDLSLGKLEAIELRRAVLLYEKASRRREEIYRQCRPLGSGWRASYRGRAEFRRKFGGELQELDHYARDLRATIMRLRGRPLQRLKSWIHINSSRSALGRSLGCYCFVLALLTAISYEPKPLLWASGTAGFDPFAQWQGFEGRLLLANAVAVGFILLVMPPLYLVRRVQLHRWNEPQIRNLRKFAAADPERSIDQGEIGEEAAQEAAADGPPVVPEMPEESTWFDVLGLSSSATIDDVKQAYKALVKQNHPDRVHGMSPIFRELAEAETKKINIAYAEALMCLRQDDLHKQEIVGAA
jgi:hypothetical protein